MTKRLFDLVVSLFTIALFLPLILVVAAAIAIADGTPIFYRQVRVGKGGRPFRINKFRSMSAVPNVNGPLVTVRGDPRIYPLGRFLRKWKIDELPQLFNVLVGNMSFVGPRPEVEHYVAMYTPGQRRVLELVPGITDVATFKFRDEEEMLSKASDPERFYVEFCMPRKIELNLEYAKNAWLGSDVVVLLKTLKVILFPRRQY
jgi:lipopolysaccharide/colanic/teichoic acid biosynthesis glycosyltransferase